jgi:lysine 6-dehydrogenase
MGIRYAVIGAGRQGTAAAYDLARHGDAECVILADVDPSQAAQAALRVNQLMGKPIASSAALDAADPHAAAAWLRQERIAAFLSAVPYYFNHGLTHAAIQAGAGMVDLGGNTEVVFAQLELSPEAEQAGISVVPDCGQVPGMGTTLIVYAMEQLDKPVDVFMWDCGLPAHPNPPWNYNLTFSIDGLTNEYAGEAAYIRDGKTVMVPTLDELEMVDFPPPIGTLEAFTTAGGISTAARTFAGKVRTLQNKTLRYPGNYVQLKTIQQLGLLDLRPVDVQGQRVVPRHVLHALWEPQIRATADIEDLIIIRILARGEKDGKAADAWVDLIHYADKQTGFTAMEQGTGWHAAIMLEAIAFGRVAKVVIPVEAAMSGEDFVAEGAKRGFKVEARVDPGS